MKASIIPDLKAEASDMPHFFHQFFSPARNIESTRMLLFPDSSSGAATIYGVSFGGMIGKVI